MRVCRLYVERYDWYVVAFFDVTAGDVDDVMEELRGGTVPATSWSG